MDGWTDGEFQEIEKYMEDDDYVNKLRVLSANFDIHFDQESLEQKYDI